MVYDHVLVAGLEKLLWNRIATGLARVIPATANTRVIVLASVLWDLATAL